MVGKAARYLANNALGALALFVALGGVSYAATGGFTSSGQLQACVNKSGGLHAAAGRQALWPWSENDRLEPGRTAWRNRSGGCQRCGGCQRGGRRDRQ